MTKVEWFARFSPMLLGQLGHFLDLVRSLDWPAWKTMKNVPHLLKTNSSPNITSFNGQHLLLKAFAKLGVENWRSGVLQKIALPLNPLRTNVGPCVPVCAHVCVCAYMRTHIRMFLRKSFCVQMQASKHPSGFRDISCFPVHWIECDPKAHRTHWWSHGPVHIFEHYWRSMVQWKMAEQNWSMLKRCVAIGT